MLYPVSPNIKDTFIGIAAGIAFIVIGTISGTVAIGLPTLPAALSDVTRFLIIVIVAPILEEIIVRGVMFPLFEGGVGTFLAMFATAGFFAGLHYYVYAAQSGALFGAFVFGILAATVLKATKNLISPIAAHATINLWLFSKALSLLVVGG